MNTIAVEMTHHGSKRIRERMGIKSKGVERIAKIALEKGIRHSEAIGNLKKYLSEVYLAYCTANNLRVYNNKIFIFRNIRLLTVLDLPQKFMNIVVKIKERRNRVLVVG